MACGSLSAYTVSHILYIGKHSLHDGRQQCESGRLDLESNLHTVLMCARSGGKALVVKWKEEFCLFLLSSLPVSLFSPFSPFLPPSFPFLVFLVRRYISRSSVRSCHAILLTSESQIVFSILDGTPRAMS